MITGWDKFDTLSDYVKHFIVSAFLIVLCMFIYQDWVVTVSFFGLFEYDLNDRLLSFLTVVAIGIGKELWDKYRGTSGFSFFDLIADFAGIFAGFVLWQLLLWLVLLT